MIKNLWKEPPPDTLGLLKLAQVEGWTNLPLCRHDLRVAWLRRASNDPGGTLLERHLPSRQYTAVAPTFESLVEALAWEAGEWLAVEAWRAQRKCCYEDGERIRGSQAGRNG